MHNLILVIIGFIVIDFIWLIWIRQSLFSLMQKAEQKRQIVMQDMGRLRDMVPYLLESLRMEEQSTEEWHKLLEGRKFFHKDDELKKGIEYEREILHFLQKTHIKNVHFMEAKKDILDLSGIIEKEKAELEGAMQVFNARRNKFPYKKVSVIFGLHDLSI
jgi:hypothetical protein